MAIHKRYIPITKPNFDQKDYQAIIKPLKTGWVVQGPSVKKFEEEFATFCNVKYAVATSSCTSALHLSLLALNIQPGDEVIVPSFTYIATVNAVEYCGARPIFCDIDLRTFNIDINNVEDICKCQILKKRHPKIKAIIPVSLFGLSVDMISIREIAQKYNLKVLEDAACALGAYFPTWRTNANTKIPHQPVEESLAHAGTRADAGCFSFHPRKAITTGEGGMITTNHQGINDIVRKLRDHGGSKSDLERHVRQGGSLLPEFNILGYNYRMTDIQGALGVTQLQKAKSIIKDRMKRAKKYDELLKEVEWIQCPRVPEGYIHAYQSYVCLFGRDLGFKKRKEINWNKINELNRARNLLMKKMEKRGVSVRQGTHAVHTLGYYKNKYELNDYDYPMSYIADRLSITLPLYADMTNSEQEYVLKKLMIYKKDNK